MTLFRALAVASLFAFGCAPEEAEPRRPTVNQPPVPVLLAPEVVRAGDDLEIDGRGSFDVDGEVLEAILLFGDGSEPEQFLVATHRYDEPGRYLLELYIADDEGARARARRRIVVEE